MFITLCDAITDVFEGASGLRRFFSTLYLKIVWLQIDWVPLPFWNPMRDTVAIDYFENGTQFSSIFRAEGTYLKLGVHRNKFNRWISEYLWNKAQIKLRFKRFDYPLFIECYVFHMYFASQTYICTRQETIYRIYLWNQTRINNRFLFV